MMMRLPTVARPVPPVTYPPLLRVDGLGLVLHLEISRDPVGSVIAATPSTQRSPKELPGSCPATWTHTIQSVRTVVPWLTSIYRSAVGERVEIASERDALRAPYVFTNRKAFRQLTRTDVQIGQKLYAKVQLPAVFGCKALVCGEVVHKPGERRFQMNKVQYSNQRGRDRICLDLAAEIRDGNSV